MTEIDVVIYDFDGVIADTGEDIAYAVQNTQKHFGKKVMTIPEIISFVGFGASYLIKNTLPDIPEERHEEILGWYKSFYYEHSIINTKLYPTVEETLRRFKEAGVPQFIVSNKPEAITKKILVQLGIDDCFHDVFGPESLTKMKPDPEGLIKAMETVGRHKGIMVGDTYSDIKAGRAAGIKTMGLTKGLGDPERLKEEKPDILAEKLGEIFDYIVT